MEGSITRANLPLLEIGFTMDFKTALECAQQGQEEVDVLAALLGATSKADTQALFDAAYEVKKQNVGPVAYFRGLVEFSNVCQKDCYYCGIRKGNRDVTRFTLSADEIVESALWSHTNEYGSVVLQSGERQDEGFVDLIEESVARINEGSGGELGITLSVGEQSRETYDRWFAAGAHRYLLRIESSNPDLYHGLHPESHSFTQRLQCLADLKEAGYQVGTGVMVGLPGQTVEDLARDILFFREIDADMLGMGPYIVHGDTPMAAEVGEYSDEEHLMLGLKMIAVCRLILKDVNIAAATALQALNPTGRELGLQAGANVIMPNVTETKYREAYQLYNGKPCMDENATKCRGCLQRRIESVGETIGFGQRGDSPHFGKRTGAK